MAETAGPSRPELEAAAQASYEAAAARSGVTVRDLHAPRELADAQALCDEVWPTVGGGTQVTGNLLKAIEHAGGYVVAAYSPRGETVGAALGFLGRHRDRAGAWETHLHSHMAAVAPAWRDRSVGTALKRHQRWWALRHDVPVVTWTFDPLVRRNARLNLVKLGTEVAAYLPDFYGEMGDEVNAGDHTDRLLAWWRVGSPRAVAAAAGERRPADHQALRDAGAVEALTVVDGAPQLHDVPAGQVRLVPLPDDIVALRGRDPELALAWRFAVREALHGALVGGAVVDTVTDRGAYVVLPEAGES